VEGNKNLKIKVIFVEMNKYRHFMTLNRRATIKVYENNEKAMNAGMECEGQKWCKAVDRHSLFAFCLIVIY
jgi:hypothetical protein